MLSEKDTEMFMAIAQQHNISRAAEQLHIAQPALSRSLRKLEEKLGAELFDRSTSPLELTQAGNRYLFYAKRYQDLLYHMEEDFSNLSEVQQGNLNVGMPSHVANYFFPKVITPFLQKYHDISINMKYGTTAQLHEILKTGKLHLSILSAPLYLNDFSNDTFAYDSVVLAVPVRSDGKPAKSVWSTEEASFEFDRLMDKQFFITEAFYKSSVKPLLQRLSVTLNKVTFVPNMSVAWDLVLKGFGPAFIQHSMFLHSDSQNVPNCYEINCPEAIMRFSITYKNSSLEHNDLLRLFINHCKSNFSDGQI